MSSLFLHFFYTLFNEVELTFEKGTTMLATILTKTAIILSMVTTPVGGMVYTTNVDDAVFSIEKVTTDKFRMTFDYKAGGFDEFPEYSVEEYYTTTVTNAKCVLDTVRMNNF